ncbi:MAG: hypothetical protein HC772_12450 [Leptolyngbyaceae cyanobacterium CRU_2_3]|nr:hypothetical protein [Leptolyngbyaceae cyanobacterium CRU_2_3]
MGVLHLEGLKLMSNYSNTANSARASKIQITVKPIEQHTPSRTTSAQLDVDADGSDLNNE